MYILEKLYYIYELDFFILFVVRGVFMGKIYIFNGIYIDIFDFKILKDLVKIFKEIGNNKLKYVKMLRVKDVYIFELYL